MWEVVFLVTLFCSYFSSAVAIACGDNEYIHHGRCCAKCSKGFYVEEHCHNDTTPTKCHPCEGMTFAKYQNSNSQCVPCFLGPCKVGMHFKTTCNMTSDNSCHCPPNKYYSEGLLACTKCLPCPAGTFSLNVCKGSRICRKCPKGRYSNLTENYKPGCTELCRKCTKYKRECNTTHDAICDVITTAMPTTDGRISEGTSTIHNHVTEVTAEQGSFGDFHKVLIAVIVIVFVVLLLLTLCYIVRRKQKVVCQRSRWKSIADVDESASYEMLSTGLLLREQPASLLYKLHEYLNPPAPNNWKTLAAALGYRHIEISNFAVDPHSSAERMLASWQTKDNTTVDLLHRLLIQIGRDDAATFLRENVVVNETESLV